MAAKKAAAKPAKKEHKEVAGFIQSATLNYLRATIKENDKKLDLVSGHSKGVEPISSGSLVIDFVLNGGYHPIFNQITGPEGAGKSTAAMSALASAYKTSVPWIEMWDAEASVVPDYAEAMFSAFDLSEVFDEGSRAGYYQDDILEHFSGKMASMIKAMPDKVWNDQVGAWCYSVKKGSNKRAQKISAALKAAGLKEDKAASKDTRWLFPTDFGGPEGFVIADSWAAFKTEKVEEEGLSNQMGGNATPLGRNLKLFGSAFQKKGVILFSTNQIRENPGASKYQDPMYEPGGNALKHYTQMRMRMFPRAVPQEFTKDKENGSLCIEESISGEGYDYYAFKAVNNHKHKMGRPMLKGMIRIWVSDENGQARGIDPHYDTYAYLKRTGQIVGKSNSFQFKFRPSIKSQAVLALQELTWTYELLKELVIAEHFNMKDHLKDLAMRMGDPGKKGKAAQPGFTKFPKLREALFQQIRTDEGLWSTKVSEAEEDYEAEDGDDDE